MFTIIKFVLLLSICVYANGIGMIHIAEFFIKLLGVEDETFLEEFYAASNKEKITYVFIVGAMPIIGMIFILFPNLEEKIEKYFY